MKEQFDNSNMDHSLKRFESDMRWNKANKQKLKQKILTSIDEYQPSISDNEYMVSISHSSKKRLLRKTLYVCGVMIVLFGLLISSAFFSPAMAEIVSKFPYLNKVFKSEPINQVISKELEDKGYKISGFSAIGGDWIVYIDGSEQYVNKVRDDVEKITEKILQSREYDKYKAKALKEPPNKGPSLEEMQQEDEIIKIDDALQRELKNHSFYNVNTQVGTLNNAGDLNIYIEIPKSEQRTEAIKDLVRVVITENTNKKYTLKFKKYNLEIREQEQRWGKVIGTIIEGLYSKEEYQVKGFSYSASPQPMTLFIKTSILSSNPNSKELGWNIENTIREFLESEEVREIINDDDYRIIVYSKEKKKIN